MTLNNSRAPTTPLCLEGGAFTSVLEVLIFLVFSVILVLRARLWCSGLPRGPSCFGCILSLIRLHFSFYFYHWLDWSHGTWSRSCRCSKGLHGRWRAVVAWPPILHHYNLAGHTNPLDSSFYYLLYCLIDSGVVSHSALWFCCCAFLSVHSRQILLCTPRCDIMAPPRVESLLSFFPFFLCSFDFSAPLCFVSPTRPLSRAMLSFTYCFWAPVCAKLGGADACNTLASGYPRLSKCRIHALRHYETVQ